MASRSRWHTEDEVNAIAEVGSHLKTQHKPSNSNMGQPETKSTKPSKICKPAWEVIEARSPESLECYECKSYHPLSDIQKFALPKDHHFPPTPCMKLDQEYRTAKFIHPDFHLTAFRMVMKQHRLTRDCTELLKLLSYRSEVLMEGAQVKKVIATPNIVAGQLLMCVQTTYVVPPEQSRESRLYLTSRNHLKCPHSTRYTRNNRKIAWKIVNRFAALDSLPKGHREILHSAECEICFTKFQVGLQRFEGEGTMLFITKWQNLGTGLSPMRSDIPCIVGPKLLFYVPFEGMGQRLLSEPLQFAGQNLDSSSTLTLMEREHQFSKSESKDAQKKRARETFYWRWWGRQACFVHEFPDLIRRKS